MGITREEMWDRIGLRRYVEPITESAYKLLETQVWEENLDDDPHGEKWHLSFHASRFPSDNGVPSCSRKSIYELMDIPKQFKISRRSRQFMQAGKDLEDQFVWAWHRAGYLLTPPPEAEHQYRFEDKESWLTGSPDAILLKKGFIRPHVVDVKATRDRYVEAMIRLTRRANPQHVNQLKCYIGFAHEGHPFKEVRRCFNSGRLIFDIVENGDKLVPICPEHGRNPECIVEQKLLPPLTGSLYYVSFDDPAKTFEFRYRYDPEFMRVGRERLQEWKVAFLAGELPQTNFQKKRWSHPFNWQWSKPEFPCQYCDLKKVCQEDHKDALETGKLVRLEDSHAIIHGQRVRKSYDYEEARARVLERWEEEDVPVLEKEAA